MFRVLKEKKESGVVCLRFIGAIEESIVFHDLIGDLPSEVEVHCKEVSRINSIGVKAWIKYFQEFKDKKIKLKFVECSVVIVEQINLVLNFVCDGLIESIYVPFACSNCNAELVGLFQTEDLKKMNFTVPSLACLKCDGIAEFDDIAEEYFSFLAR